MLFMKTWCPYVLPLLGVFVLAVDALLILDQPFSVTYTYRIDLNVSDAVPSLNAAINLLQNQTLVSLSSMLMNDQEDAPIRIVDIETVVEGSCNSISKSELCSFADSTINLLLAPDIDSLVAEYASLVEVQSWFESFNRDNENIRISFVGPSVVRTDIAFRLADVNRTMSAIESAIFQDTLVSVIGPPLLLVEPPIVVRTAIVFLQHFALVERMRRSRRLQQTTMDNVVHVHVTGQCNGCTSSQFGRIFGEAIDTHRGTLERMLQDDGHEEEISYFDSVVVSVEMVKGAPGISESGLEIFTPPDPVPGWILIGLAVCVTMITVGICFAACRSRQARSRESKSLGRTLTATESKDEEAVATEGEEARSADEAPESQSRKVNLDVMPHLRKQVHERLARQKKERHQVESPSS